MVIFGILPEAHKRIQEFKKGWRTANFSVKKKCNRDRDYYAEERFEFVHKWLAKNQHS